MRYNSTYDALVALNEALGGDQTSPISEYDAVLNVMSTLTGEEVSGDVLDVVSDTVVKAENGELPIQGGEIKRCRLRTLNVTENGHYEPDGRFEGWNEVNVDIPSQITEPVIEYLGLDRMDDNGFSFKIKMSEGNPSWISGYGCPYFDWHSYTDEGNGIFSFNIEGNCMWDNPYAEIHSVTKPNVIVDGVSCILTWNPYIRIDFV